MERDPQQIPASVIGDPTAAATNTAPSYLDRSAMLNAQDEQYEDVHVPEWNGTVRIKALTATERDAWESSMTKEVPDPSKGKGKTKYVTDATNIRAKLVARCAVDGAGKRIFGDGDIVHLGNKNAAIVDRLFTVAQRISGIAQEDVDKLEGNSDAVPSENSSAS